MSSPVDVGDVIAGKYVVERVLGVGGMGVVVAAKHKTLGERYAIKFLLPQGVASDDVRKRFRQEAMAAARLRSEHVTRVYDDGELPDGSPFLVMEYLDGRDLSAVLRDEAPLAVPRVVGFVMQACEALAEAHAAGIIHRDLKPSNLFVIKRLDGTPSIKLIDFGISKVQLPDADGEAGGMTATAVMMGSPLYMAPEQMASARDVDARADIWSLGIILHTLLAGTPPFRAPTVMGVYEAIVAGAPPVRKQRPDVPERLEAAILKCLQKDRRQRFSDVGELSEAIAPFGHEDAPREVSRIKRIIAARAATSISAPPAAAAAVTPPEGPSKSASERPAPLASSASSPSLSSSRSSLEAQGTGGSWDQRTPTPSARGTRRAVIIASAIALSSGVPIAFLVMRSQTAPVSTAPSSAPDAPSAVAPPASADTRPSVSPALTAPPSADPPPAPSASASVPVPVSARASASAPPPKREPAPPPRPPHRRSDGDLFNTQK